MSTDPDSAAIDDADLDKWWARIGEFAALEEAAKARLKAVEPLLTDDPSTPVIVDLGKAVGAFWSEDEEMLKLLRDLRWSEVERDFARGRLALRALAPLGPVHAGMERRFSRIATVMFACYSTQSLKAMYPDGNGVDRLFTGASAVLHEAAKASAMINAPSMACSEEQARDLELALAEGVGMDIESFRTREDRVVKSVRNAIRLAWSKTGAQGPVPAVFVYDKFYLPGVPRSPLVSGLVAGVYQPTRARRERIALSRPMLNMSVSRSDHRISTPLDNMSAVEMMSWEPCMSMLCEYGVLDIVIHEMTHALARRTGRIVGESSPYAEAFNRYFEGETNAPTTMARIGLIPMLSENMNQADICVGVCLLDEALTEAAAMEITSIISPKMPLELRPSRQNPWKSVLAVHPYRQGLDLISEIFPDTSALDVVGADDSPELLVAAIKRRLSPEGAKRLLELLFEGDEYLDRALDFMVEAAMKGPHLTMFEMIRDIIAQDDATKLEPVA